MHKPGENMEGIQDASVDVVIGTTVFCQVKDMKKVLSEIKRVLVPVISCSMFHKSNSYFSVTMCLKCAIVCCSCGS